MFSYRQIPLSGISYSLLLEWFLAARWAGLDWFNDFDALDGEDMAFIVAAYRTSMRVDAVVEFFARKKK